MLTGCVLLRGRFGSEGKQAARRRGRAVPSASLQAPTRRAQRHQGEHRTHRTARCGTASAPATPRCSRKRQRSAACCSRSHAAARRAQGRPGHRAPPLHPRHQAERGAARWQASAAESQLNPGRSDRKARKGNARGARPALTASSSPPLLACSLTRSLTPPAPCTRRAPPASHQGVGAQNIRTQCPARPEPLGPGTSAGMR